MVNLNNLFSFMSSNGLTAKKISTDTGISTGNISDWKRGRSMPTANKLVILADYLGCSIDYLVGRTDDPQLHTKNNVMEKTSPEAENKPQKQPKKPIIKLPIYPQPVSAGTGLDLFDADPEWIAAEKNKKTNEADFIVIVSGDSMLPKFHDGDLVLIKQTPSVQEGEIGIFSVDNESYIKKMGVGELISLNPNYDNIPLNEWNDIKCFGLVIGVLDE